MKFAVGTLCNMLGDGFKYRFTNVRIIEADYEKEALTLYGKDPHNYHMYIKCLGTVTSDFDLHIKNFTMEYPSGKLLRKTPIGLTNYLVTRLLEEPKKLTPYSLYMPQYIQALSKEDALEVYKNLYKSSQFEARVIGHVDKNGTLIVYNLLDYIA